MNTDEMAAKMQAEFQACIATVKIAFNQIVSEPQETSPLAENLTTSISPESKTTQYGTYNLVEEETDQSTYSAAPVASI